MQNYILVLDFGSQFTQLIARRIRELGVFSEIRACTLKPSELDLSRIKAVILSGGPASVTDKDAPAFDPKWLELGLPVLGVCYGMQLLAHLSGAPLGAGISREYGHTVLEVKDNSSLFAGFDTNEKTHVWMSHGDHVEKLPAGFKLLASTPGSPIAAIGNDAKRCYAVQFHPELVASGLKGWLDWGGDAKVAADGQDPDILMAMTIAEEPKAVERTYQLVDAFLEKVAKLV